MQGTHNRIVVHYKDGKLRKGYTHDFMPQKDSFHLISEQESDRGSVHVIRIADLKAIFFVKTLSGDRRHGEKPRFEEVDAARLRGIKIRIEFKDGEVVRGTTLGYNKANKGFFISDIDPQSNNERIYVLADAVKDVKLRDAAEE
jgi:hypothetical protein